MAKKYTEEDMDNLKIKVTKQYRDHIDKMTIDQDNQYAILKDSNRKIEIEKISCEKKIKAQEKDMDNRLFSIYNYYHLLLFVLILFNFKK